MYWEYQNGYRSINDKINILAVRSEAREPTKDQENEWNDRHSTH